ncbi:hypothetical protein NLI96_g954 [Meripilus lineatus]|uniref:Uncharacterized protein n=1 Tax=Meripilus lineatus TaxID=2056292 RepID=A0AAD5VB67_9APHY|nr:hypothetical protein NLI96_g954 [Physisporinus lineatus]
MGREDKHSTKHKRHHDHDERKSKKRHKSSKSESTKSSRHKEPSGSIRVVDDDPNEDDMWEEKNVDMDGEKPIATEIPTAEALKLTSRATTKLDDPPLPTSTVTETTVKRDEWMLAPRAEGTVPGDESGQGKSESFDFFSNLGAEKIKKPRPDAPNPDQPKISSKELNPDLRPDAPRFETPQQERKTVPGGPGSQWRMMRLRRVYETAEEEGKPVEEIALDRFGSLEAFEEAKAERRILDERAGRRSETPTNFKGKGRDGEHEKRFMFTDVVQSGASSRSSTFRRPDVGGSIPSTPSPAGGPPRQRYDSLRLPSQAGKDSPAAMSRTPIPTVMTPQGLPNKSRALSPSSLNKLQAKALRAKLRGAPDAASLEKEYEEELRRSSGGGDGEDQGRTRTQVEVLPTLDAQGRLYDVGQGKDDGKILPGNRKKKEKVETRDPKTGELVRYNADDDTTTLGEMLRQERFGAGMADQKNLDAQYAKAIMSDGKFTNDLDYIDENAEKLGRQKMRSDAMKRQFAINDYKRTQKALATCQFCYGEDDSPPKAAVIAMGTRAYLSCTLQDELTEGHCLIVPIQHHLTLLEGDDDVWDEIRNFMKCLMRMFAEQGKGVIFYETVISLKRQLHSYIECVPLPWDKFEDAPGYFKESILTSEAEWSQHKKLIDFSARPGGFRRAMVPNLPYFMVQFDYKGEKGYGHVIEGSDGADGEDDAGMDEPTRGEFPRYFAGEIIGNMLDLEPRRWRRPRRIGSQHHKERISKFKKMYDKFDWTGMIGRS